MLASLEKGAGFERVNRPGIAIEPGPAARLGIYPTEGVLDGVYVRP